MMSSVHRSIFIGILAAIVGLSAGAQTTQPADASPSQLEVRAMQAFNGRQYAIALPMLKEVAATLTKQGSDRVGQIQEDIRVSEIGIANAKAAASAPPPDYTKRTPHPVTESGKVLDTTIKELGNFDYDADKGGNIPADVTALSGTKIRLRGYMIPIDQASSITQFALVTDLMSCCFGQPPQIQHTVVATCPKGKAVGYYPDEITVEGILKVEEKKDDGFIVSIFEVDVTSVKPSAK